MAKFDPQIRLLATLALYVATVAVVAVPRTSGILFWLAIFAPIFFVGAALWIFVSKEIFPKRGWVATRQPLLLPEWGLVVDLLAPPFALTAATHSFFSQDSRVAFSLSDLPGAFLFLVAGYVGRRSITLLRGRFLLDPDPKHFSTSSRAAMWSDIGSLVSRLFIIPVLIALSFYLVLPAWLIAGSCLLGWIIHSSTSRSGIKQGWRDRIAARIAYPREESPEDKDLGDTPAYREARNAVLSGKANWAFLLRRLGLMSRSEAVLIKSIYWLDRWEYQRVVRLLELPDVIDFRRSSGRMTYVYQSALYHLGMYEGVEIAGQAYLDTVKSDNPFILLYMGLAAAEMGDLEKGIEYEERAVAMAAANKEDCPLALGFCGLLYCRSVSYGDFDNPTLDKAGHMLTKAMRQLDWGSAGLEERQKESVRNIVEDVFGYWLYKKGCAFRARKNLEGVIKRSPSYSWSRFHLGLQYYRLGEFFGEKNFVIAAATSFATVVREDSYSAPVRKRSQDKLESCERLLVELEGVAEIS